MAEHDAERESRAVLAGVERDSRGVFGPGIARSAARLGDHFAARDAVGDAENGGTDPIELWGRRVGRALSVVLALTLAGWLGLQLGWW